MFVRVTRGAALEEAGSPPLNIKVDVGRTPALLLFGLLFGVAAHWLFLGEKSGAAEAERVARGGA